MNILQYKTQGVANIFAPTILVNGISPVLASNSDTNNNASYPRTATITRQQNNMAQENARQANYDDEFGSMMTNLYSNENLGNEFTNNLMREVGEPFGYDNSTQVASFTPSASSGGSTGASSGGSTGASSGGSTGASSSYSGIANNVGNWYSRRYGDRNNTPVAANSLPDESRSTQWFSNNFENSPVNQTEQANRNCDLFCGEDRPCVGMCASCPVCQGREGETESQVSSTPLSATGCYALSQNECNDNSSCFYCVSGNQSENYTCRDSNNPNIGVCDKKFSSACIPISGTQGNYVLNNDDPVQNIDNYLNSGNYYPVTNNVGENIPPSYSNILEHPATCKPPIDPVMTLNNRRNAMGM
tara:strand:+ start:73 stop:1149 length:1077 start_codon:yes stop_codon:yes gene_type:complete